MNDILPNLSALDIGLPPRRTLPFDTGGYPVAHFLHQIARILQPYNQRVDPTAIINELRTYIIKNHRLLITTMMDHNSNNRRPILDHLALFRAAVHSYEATRMERANGFRPTVIHEGSRTLEALDDLIATLPSNRVRKNQQADVMMELLKRMNTIVARASDRADANRPDALERRLRPQERRLAPPPRTPTPLLPYDERPENYDPITGRLLPGGTRPPTPASPVPYPGGGGGSVSPLPDMGRSRTPSPLPDMGRSRTPSPLPSREEQEIDPEDEMGHHSDGGGSGTESDDEQWRDEPRHLAIERLKTQSS